MDHFYLLEWNLLELSRESDFEICWGVGVGLFPSDSAALLETSVLTCIKSNNNYIKKETPFVETIFF